MLQEKTFNSSAVAIHHVVGPEAGPPLILLHGITARWQSFMTLIPFLTPYWQVYALDFRGHGRSGRTPGRYRVADYAADIREFLQSQVSTQAVVVGHSLGGRVALNLAINSGELVQAIVVGDTPLTALSARGGEDNGFIKTFASWHALVQEDLPLFDFAHALGEVQARPGTDGSPRQFKDFWDQGELLFTARALQLLDADVLLQFQRRDSIADYDLLDRLKAIDCPVLFLQGAPHLGALLTDADLEIAMAQVARSASFSIPGTGHGLHRDQPLAVAQAIHNFLGAVDFNEEY